MAQKLRKETKRNTWFQLAYWTRGKFAMKDIVGIIDRTGIQIVY